MCLFLVAIGLAERAVDAMQIRDGVPNVFPVKPILFEYVVLPEQTAVVNVGPCWLLI